MAAKSTPQTLWLVVLLAQRIPSAVSIKYQVQSGEDLIAYDKQPREEDYQTGPPAVNNFTGRSSLLSSPNGRDAAAGRGDASATGDPHLQNVNGEKFDLLRPGKHLLVQIPRLSENSMLRVDAEAQRFGGKCADLYFQELNITGSWVDAKQQGGFHYHAQDVESQPPVWERFGNAQLKVAHGRTQDGTTYLNLYVRDLHRTRYPIGGLLGDDDHTEAATPPEGCGRRLSL